ncbi:MAG TPA: Maf family protein [Candidatus Levybacteria bacterium]|nr:Maf family protein [Candidatus Levybacteria bacterium]
MRKIILASSSPRRKELMKLLQIPFEVIASNYDEESEKFSNGKEMVEGLSFNKAKVVSDKYKDAVIIAADTAVVLGETVIGKPKDIKNAREILRMLSGTSHKVITGYTIFDSKTNQHVTSSVTSGVTFKNVTDAEINYYLALGEYKDKAGGYAVQEVGGVFVEDIQGDFFNVVGLPLKDIRRELENFGIKTLT